MKEYRLLTRVLPFLASIYFLGLFWNFSKVSKKDSSQKMHVEKKYLLFNLVSLDLTKIINISNSLSFMIFGFVYSL